MQNVIGHAAYLIGFALLLLKLMEFALRPHQQQKVQNLAEDWALRLSYVTPLSALKPMMSCRGQLLTLATAGSLFLCMLAYSFLLQSRSAHMEDMFVSIFCIVFFFVPTFIVTTRIGPKVAGWVYGDGRFLPFAARSACYFFGCWAIIAALQKTSGIFSIPYPLGLEWIIALPLCILLFMGILAVAGFGGLWWIMTVTFFLVAAAHGAVRIAEAVVRAVGALTWRVAEYNKGAWAAIVLVATFAFGIADFVLHYKG